MGIFKADAQLFPYRKEGSSVEQQNEKTIYREDQSGSQAVRMLRQRAKDGTLKEVLLDWLWIWSFSRGRWVSVTLYTLFGIGSSLLGVASAVGWLIAALISLGYSSSEAAKAVSMVAGQTQEADKMIFLALRGLGG